MSMSMSLSLSLMSLSDNITDVRYSRTDSDDWSADSLSASELYRDNIQAIISNRSATPVVSRQIPVMSRQIPVMIQSPPAQRGIITKIKDFVTRKCSVCRKSGHNKRNCPHLDAAKRAQFAQHHSGSGRKLPIMFFKNSPLNVTFPSSRNDICCICLESTEQCETVCGHVYHSRCIAKVDNNKCPMCRTLII